MGQELPAVVVNEIMASNANTLADEDGDFSDWIELWNTSGEAVDLEGWGLSDDDDAPYKWVFPAVQIEAGAYLLVWASSKERSAVVGQLHTSFAISGDGEPIVLTNAEGERVHRMPPMPLGGDISYGLLPGEEGFFFFDEPTPGLANTTVGYAEVLEEGVNFSHSGGFYPEDFVLTLSVDDPELTIYYTLDGSEPDAAALEGSSFLYKNSYPGGSLQEGSSRTYVYSDPISIGDRSAEPYVLAGINARYSGSPYLPQSANIFKGTVVRARAVKEHALSLRTDTESYFIAPEGAGRYDLPVVSVATDAAHFFDYESGIYVAGKYADVWVAANPGESWDDGRPGNYNQRGQDWEKPGHFEYFPGNGDPAYKHDVGLRIHGGWSRAYYRKSLRVYARNAYGSGNTLAYPFFGELPSQGDAGRMITDFRRLILRNSGNDYSLTLYRDALMHDLVKGFPMATMAYQPVVHFINGEYWGIINLRERYDQHYLSNHFNLPADDVAILEAWAKVDEGLPSDRAQFLDIVAYAQGNDPADAAVYQWLEERVDLDNLAAYYAAQIYFQNTDWPQNNMRFWRYRKGVYSPDAALGHDGRWRWMLYDTDHGMSMFWPNQAENGLRRVMEEAGDPISNLFKRLLRNTEFKHKFVNVVADMLNSSFIPAYVGQKVDEYNARLSSSRSEHYNRWRSGTDMGTSMKNFANERPAHLLSHTSSQFGLEGTAVLTVNRNGGGGKVVVNSLTIDRGLAGLPNPETPFPWSGTYFKEVPVRLSAVNEPGFRFSHWVYKGQVVEQRDLTIDLAANTDVVAHFRSGEYALIHYWHFNDLPGGDLTTGVPADFSLLDAEVGMSYPGSGAGYMDRVNDGSVLNIRNEAEEGRALRVRNPSDTRHLEIRMPTTGFEDLKVSYAVTRTGSGAQLQNVYYRVADEQEWVLFREGLLITESYQRVELDFLDLAAVSDREEFSLKIEFDGSNASGGSGNNRFDNFVVEGYRKVETGFEAAKEAPVLNVFPVPAREFLNIASSDPLLRVVLYGSQGQVLRRESAAGLSHQLNVAALSPGVYVLEATTQQGVQRRKISIGR